MEVFIPCQENARVATGEAALVVMDKRANENDNDKTDSGNEGIELEPESQDVWPTTTTLVMATIPHYSDSNEDFEEDDNQDDGPMERKTNDQAGKGAHVSTKWLEEANDIFDLNEINYLI